MRCLSGRVLTPEILDTLPYEQACASLQDLTRINRRWGGHSTLRHLLRDNVEPDETFSLLDVGRRFGRHGGSRSRVVSARPGRRARPDRLPSEQRFGVRAWPQMPFISRCAAKVFDFIFCSLFLAPFHESANRPACFEGFRAGGPAAVLVIDWSAIPSPIIFFRGANGC